MKKLSHCSITLKLWVPILISLVLTVLLVTACGNAPAPTEPPTETAADELLSVADLMNEPTEEGAEEATPGPVILNPLPPLTIEEVEAAWETSDQLDSRHHEGLAECANCHEETPAEGVTLPACHSCHDPAADDPYTALGDELCLTCHGGTYGALADQTKNYEPAVPHDYHYSFEVKCVDCHPMHQTGLPACSLCHTDVSLEKIENQ